MDLYPGHCEATLGFAVGMGGDAEEMAPEVAALMQRGFEELSYEERDVLDDMAEALNQRRAGAPLDPARVVPLEWQLHPVRTQPRLPEDPEQADHYFPVHLVAPSRTRD